MPSLPAVIAKPIIGLAFAFALRWLWELTGIVAIFTAIEAALAFALTLAAAFDEVQLAVCLRN